MLAIPSWRWSLDLACEEALSLAAALLEEESAAANRAAAAGEAKAEVNYPAVLFLPRSYTENIFLTGRDAFRCSPGTAHPSSARLMRGGSTPQDLVRGGGQHHKILHRHMGGGSTLYVGFTTGIRYKS